MHQSITNFVSHPTSIIYICLVIVCLTVPVSTVCPNTTQFLLVSTNQCYSTCPWQAPTKYYSYLPTNTCELICPGTYYGFDGNKSCTTACPSTPIQTYYDTVNKVCVSVCPVNYFGYLGSVVASNQFCVQSNSIIITQIALVQLMRIIIHRLVLLLAQLELITWMVLHRIVQPGVLTTIMRIQLIRYAWRVDHVQLLQSRILQMIQQIYAFQHALTITWLILFQEDVLFIVLLIILQILRQELVYVLTHAHKLIIEII